VFASQSATIPDMFRRRVAASGDLECYRHKVAGEWYSTTWSGFASAAEHLSAALIDAGLSRGDSVAILGSTQPPWCIADMGAILIGVRTVGVYPTLMRDQMAFIMNDAKCKALFIEGTYLDDCLPLLDEVATLERIIVWEPAGSLSGDRVESMDDFVARGLVRLQTDNRCVAEAEARIERDDAALIVYTSGTTGRPKGVPLTHHNVLASLAAGEPLMDPLEPDDITLSFLPMAHVGEHVPGFFGRMNIGLCTAYATNYETVLDELLEIRPTYFGAVPRIFEKMYGRIHEEVAKANPRRQAIFNWAKGLACRRARAEQGGAPLSLKDRMLLPVAEKLIFRRIRAVFGGRVKGFITGSAPIHIDILEFFFGIGMRIIELYGLSEATAISFANTMRDIRLGTVGKPLPGVEYRFAEDGELLLRGPTVFGGYLNLESENAQTFTEDGFLRTGDIGEIDDAGCLRITDRKKNLIKTAGGKYVIPARIEQLVKSEPLVSQIYIHGDMRPYVVALVTLDERETPRVAEELGVEEQALCLHPEVKRRIGLAFDRANAQLARFEQVKYHQVLSADFSIEEGTLTPTMKLKRRRIVELYSDRIDGMYSTTDRPQA
jgi:long-chain acyl-CoA synthetase